MADMTDERFAKAYEMASNTDEKFAYDTLLYFYAYYKRATQTEGPYTPEDKIEIRKGFKENALLQVEKLSQEEAKEKYIELVEKYIGKV
jgi:diazepam-binding inhibitor (GABA receptor modulator, acyl-CoA-binding protein)